MLNKKQTPMPPYNHIHYRRFEDKLHFTCRRNDVLKMPVQRLTNRLYKANAAIMTGRGLTIPVCPLTGDEFKNWFVGYDMASSLNGKDRHTILFYFSEDGRMLDVFYFTLYDRYGLYDRKRFACSVIPELKKLLS